jgi:hypothetical protein
MGGSCGKRCKDELLMVGTYTCIAGEEEGAGWTDSLKLGALDKLSSI